MSTTARLKFQSFMQRELSKLTERKVKLKKYNTEAWLCCPWHKNGQERTPSLRVRLDPDHRAFSYFRCHACPEYGPYNKLAEKTGIAQYGEKFYDNEIPDIEFRDLEVATQYKKIKKEPIMPKDAFDWPAYDNWRNISGKTVTHMLGGKMYFDEYAAEPRLFLPAHVNEELVGGVRCNIKPVKGGVNYFNTPGPWSLTNFLFFDEAEKRLQSLPKNKRVLTISEGPRDGANVMQYGVPGIVNLGAVNSWSKAKAALVLSMSAERIILAFDPDEAGMMAASTAREDLEKYIQVDQLIFETDEMGNKLRDLSDLTREECLSLYDFRE